MAKRWKRCERGVFLRELIMDSELGENVVPLRVDPDEERTRVEFIKAGKAYCVARCGGCELTGH